MKKTYRGSCHCKAVRFEADLDLMQGTGRCNCSYCAKVRSWGILLEPADFRLLAGEDTLADYQFNSRSAHHHFCRICGVKTHTRGDIPEIGGAFVSLSVAAIDDIPAGILATLPVGYADGRNDNWQNAPAVTAHL